MRQIAVGFTRTKPHPRSYESVRVYWKIARCNTHVNTQRFYSSRINSTVEKYKTFIKLYSAPAGSPDITHGDDYATTNATHVRLGLDCPLKGS